MLRLPIAVLEREVLEAAQFCRRHWRQRKTREGTLPALSSACAPGVLSEKIERELLDGLDAFQEAEKHRKLLLQRISQESVQAAHATLSEMKLVLRYALADSPKGQAQLRNLTIAHRLARSHDAVAGALYNYAALADAHAKRLASIPAWDPQTPSVARTLALALRERSAGPSASPPAEETSEYWMARRNELGAELVERVRTVRAAARLVFRRHPEIVREVMSSYERERRAAGRARRKGKAGPVAVSS